MPLHPPSSGRGSNQYQRRGATTAGRSRREIGLTPGQLAEQWDAETVAWAFRGDDGIEQRNGRSASKLIREATHPDSRVRARLAASVRCPDDVLARLLEDADIKVRSAVAGNRHASDRVLLAAAARGHVMSVLANPSCPRLLFDQVLYKVKARDWSWVRAAVRNPNCPEDVLVAVSEATSDRWLLTGVAGHPNTPSSALAQMAFLVRDRFGWSEKDSADFFRRMCQNPACPDYLIRNACHQKDQLVWSGAAMNPNCPEDVLERLAREGNQRVRRAVVNNAGCPPPLRGLARRG